MKIKIMIFFDIALFFQLPRNATDCSPVLLASNQLILKYKCSKKWRTPKGCCSPNATRWHARPPTGHASRRR